MKDSNVLIAEFMELDIIPLEQFVLGVQSTIARIKIGRKDYICPMVEGYLLEHLQYHTSWDWLMPVVEKIESLRDSNGDAYRFSIDMCNAQIEGANIEIIGGAFKLDTTYRAVVEFIKQHNKKA
jgi:hypothetical protein